MSCCQKCSCDYDYIIVGNGTAGAVVARKLSDDYSIRVLVIEVGRNRTTDPIITSPNVFLPGILNEITYSPKYSVCYPSAANDTNPANLGTLYPPFGSAIVYPEGRMWGGSSAHNYLQAVRGTPVIYNNWALLSGNNQWSYNRLLPIMKNIETYTGSTTNPSQRGFDGPIFITQSAPVTTDSLAIGYSLGSNTPQTVDYNDYLEGTVCISTIQEFITPPPNSQRSYSQPAYLQVGEIIDSIMVMV